MHADALTRILCGDFHDKEWLPLHPNRISWDLQYVPTQTADELPWVSRHWQWSGSSSLHPVAFLHSLWVSFYGEEGEGTKVQPHMSHSPLTFGWLSFALCLWLSAGYRFSVVRHCSLLIPSICPSELPGDGLGSWRPTILWVLSPEGGQEIYPGARFITLE